MFVPISPSKTPFFTHTRTQSMTLSFIHDFNLCESCSYSNYHCMRVHRQYYRAFVCVESSPVGRGRDSSDWWVVRFWVCACCVYARNGNANGVAENYVKVSWYYMSGKKEEVQSNVHVSDILVYFIVTWVKK